MVVSFILKLNQPFFFLPLIIDGYEEGAGIDFFTDFNGLVFKNPNMVLAHDTSHIH